MCVNIVNIIIATKYMYLTDIQSSILVEEIFLI